MFDAISAELLRAAPEVPGLNPQELPALLTEHFATLVSARLSGELHITEDSGETWPIERIANTYELIASLNNDAQSRKSSAFVAGVARQILSRREFAEGQIGTSSANIDRDRVDPAIASAILFLAAEQYADANEAASNIVVRRDNQLHEATLLSEN